MLSTLASIGLIYYIVFLIIVLGVFVLTEGEPGELTYQLAFKNSKRWQWFCLSKEEKTFVKACVWATSPILYPIIALIGIGSIFRNSLRGFKKIVFRFRSRHFDELADKISVKED